MAKNKGTTTKSHIIIFVEGDTDEVFFKALIEHYKQISTTPILPCSICNLKGVTRYTSKLLAKLKNEYLPEAQSKQYSIQTVCCSYDTDVFEVRNPLMVDWKSLAKSVKRLGIENFIQVGVKSSIEDWILDDLESICAFLKIKNIPKSLKGNDGFSKLSDLYAKARKTYQKGYESRELIASLDFEKIINRRKGALSILEEALNVTRKQQ